MKIKFITPEKLFRCHDCFFYNGYLRYDLDNKIVRPDQFEKYLKGNYNNCVISFYSKALIEEIDYNKYYEIENIVDKNEFIKLENKESAFQITVNFHKGRRMFLALRKRIYYELYDDELNLIEGDSENEN